MITTGRELNAQEFKRYEKSGCGCPGCKTGELSFGSMDMSAGVIWQAITCLGCGASWQDVYYLSTVTEYIPGDKETKQ